jgi:hypothetical protein
MHFIRLLIKAMPVLAQIADHRNADAKADCFDDEKAQKIRDAHEQNDSIQYVEKQDGITLEGKRSFYSDNIFRFALIFYFNFN